jgi:hypothetical protein
LAEFPLAFRFIAVGAEDVKARIEALFEAYSKGRVTNEEFDRSVRELHSSLIAKVRAVNMLSTAYRAAHPNLMLFSQAMSTLQSVAYRGLSLFNSYMLYQLRLGDASRDAARAKEEAERAERNYLDLLRQYGEEAPEVLKAKSDWIEASEKAKEAAEREARAQQELYIWYGLTALTAAGMASSIIANLGKIAATLTLAKTALTGLAGAVSAGSIAVAGLVAGLALLAGGLAYSFVNIVQHKDATMSWREAILASIEGLKGYPPVLRELLTVLTMAAGGWILFAEKASIALTDTAAKISSWASDVSAKVGGWISEVGAKIGGWASEVGGKISAWVSEASSKIGGWVSDVGAKISAWASETSAKISCWVTSTVASFVDWASKGLGEVARFTSSALSSLAGFVAEWGGKISAWVSENAKRFLEAGSTFLKNLSEGIKGGISLVVNALTNIGGQIAGFFTNLIGSAWGWGYRLASSIADGIRAAIGAIIAAAQEAAKAAEAFLGVRSPAEQGPLKYVEEWGPNLVKTYAEGIRRSLGVLRSAALEAASSLSVSAPRTSATTISINVNVSGGSGDVAREVSRRIAYEVSRLIR